MDDNIEQMLPMQVLEDSSFVTMKALFLQVCIPWDKRKSDVFQRFCIVLRNANTENEKNSNLQKELIAVLEEQLNDFENKVKESSTKISFSDVQKYIDTAMMIIWIPSRKEDNEKLETAYNFVEPLLLALDENTFEVTLTRLIFLNLMGAFYLAYPCKYGNFAEINVYKAEKLYAKVSENAINETTYSWMNLSKEQMEKECKLQKLFYLRNKFFLFSHDDNKENVVKHGMEYLQAVMAHGKDLVNIIGINQLFPIVFHAHSIASAALLVDALAQAQYALAVPATVLSLQINESMENYCNYDLIWILKTFTLSYLCLCYTRIKQFCGNIFNIDNVSENETVAKTLEMTEGVHFRSLTCATVFKKILADASKLMTDSLEIEGKCAKNLTPYEELTENCMHNFELIKLIVDVFEKAIEEGKAQFNDTKTD